MTSATTARASRNPKFGRDSVPAIMRLIVLRPRRGSLIVRDRSPLEEQRAPCWSKTRADLHRAHTDSVCRRRPSVRPAHRAPREHPHDIGDLQPSERRRPAGPLQTLGKATAARDKPVPAQLPAQAVANLGPTGVQAEQKPKNRRPGPKVAPWKTGPLRLERNTGFEPATFALARRRSTIATERRATSLRRTRCEGFYLKLVVIRPPCSTGTRLRPAAGDEARRLSVGFGVGSRGRVCTQGLNSRRGSSRPRGPSEAVHAALDRAELRAPPAHQTGSQPVGEVLPYPNSPLPARPSFPELAPRCQPRRRRGIRPVLVRDQGVAGSNPVSPTNPRPRVQGLSPPARGLLFSSLRRFGHRWTKPERNPCR